MKRPMFIAKQSAKPSGMLGRLIAGIMAHETAALNDRAVELLGLQATDRVLEIGYGHGRTVERIANALPLGHVAGIDPSDSMHQLASHRNRSSIANGRVDLRLGDGAALPFGDSDFDKALSVHTVYFWRDPAACLREIHRVLRPGARLVLGFTPKGSPRVASFPSEVYTFHSEHDIRTLLLTAGFSPTDRQQVGDNVLLAATAKSASS